MALAAPPPLNRWLSSAGLRSLPPALPAAAADNRLLMSWRGIRGLARTTTPALSVTREEVCLVTTLLRRAALHRRCISATNAPIDGLPSQAGQRSRGRHADGATLCRGTAPQGTVKAESAV